MRVRLGQPISYKRTGLRPNRLENVRLCVTDKLGKSFQTEQSFKTNQSGLLSIGQDQFRDFIALASTKRDNCFLIPEFEQFSVNLVGDSFEGTSFFFFICRLSVTSQPLQFSKMSSRLLE